MPRLKEFLRREQRTLLSGPYGTEIAERVARDMAAAPMLGSGIFHIEHLGAGCSALLSSKGRTYVRELSDDYAKSIPENQAIVLVTDTFRLPHQVLKAAALATDALDDGLPSKGLEFNLNAMRIAKEATAHRRDNTLIAASIGPPFDCYRGEDTPEDIGGKYEPQVFATVRFCPDVDYLMFETTPSLAAAIGAARAFTRAHQKLNVVEANSGFRDSETIQYCDNLLRAVTFYNNIERIAPTYNPLTRVFGAQEQLQDYVISFCLEENAELHTGRQNGKTLPLDQALDHFFSIVESEELYVPAGFGINCNSPEVTRRALEAMSDTSRKYFVATHPNASSANNPRGYATMMSKQAIPDEEFAPQVVDLAQTYDLAIVGGCCGTHPGTMTRLHKELTGK